MTRTAVVILNYNGEKLLRQFLPSVIQYSTQAEIIVADNGSTDNSIPILQQDFSQVRIIRLDKNYGFCGGYNRALQQVSADYFVLLNSDVEVTSDWLVPMTTLLDTDQSISAVQPKILSYRDKKKFEYAGAAGGFIDAFGYPFCRGRIFDHIEVDKGQYDDERPVFWGSGACLIIRSDIYKAFGGLDEDFFAHMEEIDLCWKINRAGKQVYYCGKSTVYHLGAGTLDYENPRKVYLNFRNGLALIFKHFNSTELIFKFPFRIMLDWVAALSFFVKGRWQCAWAVIRAHLHFFTRLSLNYRKRQNLQKVYPGYPRKHIHSGLIVFDYYIKGKRNLT
jgi:hypothetical protein